jgi:hypothetical protein
MKPDVWHDPLFLAALAANGKGGTASGSIVTFRAYGDPLRSLRLDIDPLQSGTGVPAPDNLRPISGRTGASVFRTGRNMFDEATAVLYDRYINVNASPKLWSYGASSKSIAFSCKPNTTYSVSCSDPDAETVITIFRVGWIESGIPSGIGIAPVVYGVFDVGAAGTVTLTTGANATYIIVQINAAILSARNSQLQIELGSTATDYESYRGTTYPITIPTPPGTVYGGTLDLTTGVLTVTHANIASYNGETINEPWISSEDVYTSGATPTTGAQVVYPLTSPQTYQLTPTEVETLLADNTVWADCGNISVEWGNGGRISKNILLAAIMNDRR